MKHHETKEVLSKRSEIREAAYCVDLLDNRKPKSSYENEIKMKDLIHEIRMKESIEKDIEFSAEMFYKSLDILRIRNKDKH